MEEKASVSIHLKIHGIVNTSTAFTTTTTSPYHLLFPQLPGTQCFTHICSFNPCNNTMSQVLLSAQVMGEKLEGLRDGASSSRSDKKVSKQSQDFSSGS